MDTAADPVVIVAALCPADGRPPRERIDDVLTTVVVQHEHTPTRTQ